MLCEVNINVSFALQLSKPVEITSVVILWRKKNSDVFYTNPDTGYGSFYSLNGLEANTSYEIQVQIISGSYSAKSDLAFATTREEQDGMSTSVF